MKKVLLVLVVLLVSTSAFAQTQYRTEAKFVCGRPDVPEIDAFAFAPGVYYTSINVTNPNDTGDVFGRKRFSVGLLNQKVGPYTGWVSWVLKPGETMQVDCGDIYKHLGIPPGTFIDGFMHFVGNPVRFSVTSVYTVTDGARVVSQDVVPSTIRP
ncbi:MAG TPA: hypothetical protein VF432_31500 [Thermoanaerobaculia bacterium]